MAVVATGRIRHDERVPDAPRGRIPKDATQRERMARRLRTKPGRADYARRKSIVDQVFEQMKTRKHARHLRLRGVAGAKGEWTLHATCHNLRKLANTAKTAPLPGTRPSARVPWRHGSGGSTRIDKSPAMILAQIRPNLDQQQNPDRRHKFRPTPLGLESEDLGEVRACQLFQKGLTRPSPWFM